MIMTKFNIAGNYFPFGIYIRSRNTAKLEIFLINTYGKEYIGYINTSGTWFKIGRYIWFKNKIDRDSVISLIKKGK
jgi:hypothetical protein